MNLTIDIEKVKAAKACLEQEKKEREERMKLSLEAKEQYDKEIRFRNQLF